MKNKKIARKATNKYSVAPKKRIELKAHQKLN